MKTILATLILLLFFGCASQTTQPLETNQPAQNLDEICFEENCIQIERADTPQEQQQGLMFRENLCENCGMLFIFPNEQPRTFWMKNTIIPLDMIWINTGKKVVGVTKNATPCQADPCPLYYSPAPAKYVLEVNAGHAEQVGVQNGALAVFEE